MNHRGADGMDERRFEQALPLRSLSLWTRPTAGRLEVLAKLAKDIEAAFPLQ